MHCSVAETSRAGSVGDVDLRQETDRVRTDRVRKGRGVNAAEDADLRSEGDRAAAAATRRPPTRGVSCGGASPRARCFFAGGAGCVFLGRRRKEPATGGPRPAGGGERRAAGQVWGGAGGGCGGDRPASVRVREGSRVPRCVE